MKTPTAVNQGCTQARTIKAYRAGIEEKALDHEVYKKLRYDQKIIENIAPLVMKEKYLLGRDYDDKIIEAFRQLGITLDEK